MYEFRVSISVQSIDIEKEVPDNNKIPISKQSPHKDACWTCPTKMHFQSLFLGLLTDVSHSCGETKYRHEFSTSGLCHYMQTANWRK